MFKKILSVKFRLWNWVWKSTQEGNRKIYSKYSVLWYYDAREVAQYLDDEVGAENRQDEYSEIKGNLFCRVWVDIWWFKNKKDGEIRMSESKRVRKWDCWTESNVDKEKGESSDSFKRACVKWGIGRQLYDLPNMYITKEEATANKYDITSFVRTKFAKQLKDRYERNK